MLLNTMTTANLNRCMLPWLDGSCRRQRSGPPCPALNGSLHWKAVVVNSGAWDLNTGANGCCPVSDMQIRKAVSNVRSSLDKALAFAEAVVWLTTTPVAENRGCCQSAATTNEAATAGFGNVAQSLGYCSNDAIRYNTAVERMIHNSFSAKRVVVADTHSAVVAYCGKRYYECDIQSQRLGCQVHFTPSSFDALHGPVVALALAKVLGLR